MRRPARCPSSSPAPASSTNPNPLGRVVHGGRLAAIVAAVAYAVGPLPHVLSFHVHMLLRPGVPLAMALVWILADRPCADRNASKSPSNSTQIRLTSLLEIPLAAPDALTRSSTLRVDTPCTHASITTAYKARSIRRRRSNRLGKNDLDLRKRHVREGT